MVSVTDAPSGFEGEGFPVRRAFAGVDLAQLDPFVHMDQMGEVDYGPGEPRGTPWHPHRGFETVTYMIDGTFQHQDSAGGGGIITNGDTQWMTAGAGILHIERPPEALVTSGGLFHGIQLWVNLPCPRTSGWRRATPGHRRRPGGVAVVALGTAARALVRVIAGEVAGHAGPGVTHTPMAMAHAVTVSARGAGDPALVAGEHNALLYVLPPARERSGSERSPRAHGTVGRVRRQGDACIVVSALATARNHVCAPQLSTSSCSEAGPSVSPVVTYGPFVMYSRAEIVQALDDFQHVKLGTIPADHIG